MPRRNASGTADSGSILILFPKKVAVVCRFPPVPIDLMVESQFQPSTQGRHNRAIHDDCQGQQGSEAGKLPGEELLDAMSKYNEELLKAGVLLDLAGRHPSSKRVRLQFSNGKRTVIDGPFAETKELIAGYWLIQVKSRQEAIDWALRVPCPSDASQDGHIELRQLFELAILLPVPRSIVAAPSARSSRNARKRRDMKSASGGQS